MLEAVLARLVHVLRTTGQISKKRSLNIGGDDDVVLELTLGGGKFRRGSSVAAWPNDSSAQRHQRCSAACVLVSGLPMSARIVAGCASAAARRMSVIVTRRVLFLVGVSVLGLVTQCSLQMPEEDEVFGSEAGYAGRALAGAGGEAGHGARGWGGSTMAVSAAGGAADGSERAGAGALNADGGADAGATSAGGSVDARGGSSSTSGGQPISAAGQAGVGGASGGIDCCSSAAGDRGVGGAGAGGTDDEPAVANASFEASNDFEQTVQGWSELGDVGASYVQKGRAHTGNMRLTHWHQEPFEVTTSQLLNAVPRGVYSLRMWVARCDGSVERQYIYATGHSSAAPSERRAVRLQIPSDCSYYEVVLEGINVTSGTCEVGIYTKAGASSWTNIDDVAFTKAD